MSRDSAGKNDIHHQKLLFPEWLATITKITFRYYGLLLAIISLNIASPSLEPALSLLSKKAIDSLTKKDPIEITDINDLFRILPLFIAVFAVLASINLLGHILDKILDAKLKIDFQSFYFSGSGKKRSGEGVSRIIFDCEQARKMIDIIQRDIWIVLIGIPSVLFWQIQTSKEWILPLLIAGLPGFIFATVMGSVISRWSLLRLESLESISGAFTKDNHIEFTQGQSKFYKSSIYFEIYKKTAETFADLSMWLGIIVILFLSYFIPLLPGKISAGDLAAFIVNLKLLEKPLKEMSKLYIKFKECLPAVRRIFCN